MSKKRTRTKLDKILIHGTAFEISRKYSNPRTLVSRIVIAEFFPLSLSLSILKIAWRPATGDRRRPAEQPSRLPFLYAFFEFRVGEAVSSGGRSRVGVAVAPSPRPFPHNRSVREPREVRKSRCTILRPATVDRCFCPISVRLESSDCVVLSPMSSRAKRRAEGR